MRGVNKVILLGRVGKDVVHRSFPNGDGVANTTLATTEAWKDKTSGEQKEATEWHNLVFSRGLADIARRFIKKGSRIYVEGSLRTRSWEKDGVKRYSTEIRVTDLQLLDGRPASDTGSASNDTPPNAAASSTASGSASYDDGLPPSDDDMGGIDVPF